VRDIMRALSPILSAIILIMATLAAGAIMYQYFMGTIHNMASKPMFYIYDARYLPELKVVYISADNNGNYDVNVTGAEVTCSDGSIANVPMNYVVKAGSSMALRVDLSKANNCIPKIIILKFIYNNKDFTTEPLRVS
jgi:flagellin-like protein